MTKNSTSSTNSVKNRLSPSFVKLAMKNMVRKGNQSLFHFSLTAAGFLAFIILIAVLGRPTLP